MSFRSQKVMIYWAASFGAVYCLALVFLLRMLPPPNAHQSAISVANWYAQRHTQIRIGAVIASYTGAFLLPFFIVVAEQVRRVEGPGRAWQWATLLGGGLMSIFTVLPPIFWGVAAFTTRHVPEVTQLMHQLGMLSFVTTDQYFIFAWVAVAVMCFLPEPVARSPFRRWFGYLTIWAALLLEAGAIAFLAHSGPLAWNGLLALYVPLAAFGVWAGVLGYLMLTSIRRQQAEAEAEPLSA